VSKSEVSNLHVVHVNLASGFRGGERQTELLIRHLAHQTGVQQTLVCRQNSPMRERLHDVPVALVSAQHAWQAHGRVARATLTHAHEARAVHWAWLHRRLRAVPYVMTRRMDKVIRAHVANRWMYRDAAAVVAVSSAIVAQVQALGVAQQVLRIPDAYAHLAYDPAVTARLRTDFAHGFLVGNVAALVDRHKGQRVLLQAARLVQAQAPDMHCADADALRAESADLANVHWLGFHPNVGDYLGLFDVFALPSRNEGMGSSLLDAMDYGVPVVASRVGGIPDIVQDGETGLLFPAGDAQALAQALLRLYHDADLRQALAALARAQLPDYTPERMAERYLALYRTIAG